MLGRSVRTSQPQGPARIDWGNPITRGLVFCALDTPSGKIEIVRGERERFIGDVPPIEVSRIGMARRLNLLGSVQFSQPPFATGISWALLFLKTGTVGQYSRPFGRTANNDGVPYFNWDFEVNFAGQGQNQIKASVYHGAGSNTANISFNENNPQFAVATAGKNLLSFYLGNSKVTQSIGTVAEFTTNSDIFFGGTKSTGVGGAFAGFTPLGLYWTRMLSDAEVKSLSDNPWQIFSSDSKALWTPAAASVSLPTLVRPTSTISAGLWVPTGAATLHETIDEEFHVDADYMSVNAASTVELELAEAAFPGGPNQTLAYWASSTQGSTLTVTLKQGVTTIMTRTHALTGTDTLYTQTLTAPEIALITAGPISVTLTTS